MDKLENNRYRIEHMANSLTPLSLSVVKKFGKDSLIEIMLLREIRFNNLVQEWEVAIKDDRVKSFLVRRINLLRNESAMATELQVLENRIERYKNQIKVAKTRCKLSIKVPGDCTMPDDVFLIVQELLRENNKLFQEILILKRGIRYLRD